MGTAHRRTRGRHSAGSALGRDVAIVKNDVADLKEGQKSIFDIVARMDRKIDALGARWGEHAEAAFREAMREILETRGVRVEVWKAEDSEGHVFGRPATVEIDVLLRNGTHTLIEIKSSLSDGDVAKLIRIGELYRQVTGQAPELAAICPFITEPAYKLAKESRLKIYTDPSRITS